MKKLVAVLSVAFLGTAAMAQEQQTSSESTLSPKFGLKLGANLSNLYVDEVDDNNMKLGPNVGFFAKLPIARGFSIQPELTYSNKGAKLRYDNFVLGSGEYRFNLHYVELPVMAVINLGSNFNIHGGPYIGYLAGATIKDMDDNGTINDATDLNAENFNRFDAGLAAGIGVDISNVTIGARYSYGMSEIGKSGSLSGNLTGDSKNSVVGIYIGIGF